MLRLLTIPISHYCEKARWALLRAGLPYREERHVQGLHRLFARRAGGGATVPVLVTPQGPLADSQLILEWADGRMTPERRLFGPGAAERSRALALCRRFDELLGPSGRRLIYVLMFDQPELMLSFNNQGVPGWEDALLRRGMPLARRFIERALAIRPGVETADEALVWSQFDEVAALLGDGRPYLLGERFSAADLTFAALAAPVLLPEHYGVPLPPLHALDARTRALVSRAREHPAGRFALRMTREERSQPTT